jgi:hypothetical protein
MLEADDLLPPELVSWMLEKLRLFRLSESNGALQLNIQDGFVFTYEDTYKHKVSGRTRHRTKPTTINN